LIKALNTDPCKHLQFFGLYTRLLSSTNYVTRRQSVKVRLFTLQFL
jgi:hypothetical protein